jgi:superfamily II RNA helicase
MYNINQQLLTSFKNRYLLISPFFQAVFPIDREYTPLVQKTGDPAKTYEFPLDRFQKEAIKCLDNNQSVLVSAHTSAGKTVVALCVITINSFFAHCQ